MNRQKERPVSAGGQIDYVLPLRSSSQTRSDEKRTVPTRIHYASPAPPTTGPIVVGRRLSGGGKGRLRSARRRASRQDLAGGGVNRAPTCAQGVSERTDADVGGPDARARRCQGRTRLAHLTSPSTAARFARPFSNAFRSFAQTPRRAKTLLPCAQQAINRRYPNNHLDVSIRASYILLISSYNALTMIQQRAYLRSRCKGRSSGRRQSQNPPASAGRFSYRRSGFRPKKNPHCKLSLFSAQTRNNSMNRDERERKILGKTPKL